MTETSRPDEPFRIRSLATTLYLPTLLFAMGQGAAIPMLALLALDLGASEAVAGAIVALRGLGMMLSDLPAGTLVSRVGDRRAMTLSSATLAVVALLIGLRVGLLAYAALVLLMGTAWSVWVLARMSYAAEQSPLAHRGRVMSMVGGVHRIGLFLGPVLGGIAVVPFGITGAFVLQAVLAGIASIVLYRTTPHVGGPAAPTSSDGRSFRAVFADHRTTLGTAGVVVVALQVLRSSREAIIPLWGNALGIGASEISLVFGISALMEIVLFYPVGLLMDRKGRKWALGPSMLLLSAGIASIPLSSDFASFVAVAVVIGLANGMGAGTNMTLGSDLSPTTGRSRFLAIWRFVSDVGTASGPLLVAGVTAVASLWLSAVTVGTAGLLGLGMLVSRVPETLASGRPGSDEGQRRR